LQIREQLDRRGLVIPQAQVVPDGMSFSYRRAVRHGNLVFIAGHGPSDGAGWGARFGKVGVDLTVEEAYAAAELTALNVLGTLDREIGGLDDVACWLKMTGWVNSGPEFTEHAQVINGATDLIRDLYGEDKVAARAAVGAPALPFDMPVEVDAILALN
jgi:enamine deaminase RidA (YjgF/YER057c/UK114 family)